MIKKLRLKFILISMGSILFVLFVTIFSINLTNYITLNKELDNSIQIVLDRDGETSDIAPSRPLRYLSDALEPPQDPGQETGPQGEGREQDILREHYFSVVIDSTGNIIKFNFNNIFSISDSDGKALALDAYNSSIYSGRYNNFKFNSKLYSDNSRLYVYVDGSERYNSFNNFLVSSIIISSISYLAIFVLIFFTSKIAFKPTEESYRKQKIFITDASHELKTPLTIISADIKLVEDDYGESEWTDSIKEQVVRLTNMTNQLVTLSKLEETNQKILMSSCNISELLNSSVETFKPIFESKKFQLETEIFADIWATVNDKLILEFFAVILENASKYTAKDGRISVSLFKDDKGKINIEFSNTIDFAFTGNPNDLFDRFYRADASRNSKTGGSGIGLSIAKSIVELHKGKISAEIKNNESIKFVIVLNEM